MVTRGFYKHYKGDVYFVEGIGTSHDNGDAGTLSESVRWVLYQSTMSCRAEDGITRMRTECEFEQWVLPASPDLPFPPPRDPEMAARVRAMGYVPRFERIGEP